MLIKVHLALFATKAIESNQCLNCLATAQNKKPTLEGSAFSYGYNRICLKLNSPNARSHLPFFHLHSDRKLYSEQRKLKIFSLTSVVNLF